MHENIVAVVHCTGGDVLITTSAFLIGTLIALLRGRPPFGWRMAGMAVALGIGYTIFSEWLNVEVRHSWSYSSGMPVLPWFGTGLSPFLQWFVVPSIAFAVASWLHRDR